MAMASETTKETSFDALGQMIDNANDINETFIRFLTPLLFSTGGQLILFGADAKGDDGDAATIRTSFPYGNEAVVRAFIVAGANINVRTNEGITPLMLATKYANAEVVCSLVDACANVEATDQEGNTALMLAATRYKGTEVVRALIDVGAYVDATNNEGMTALMLAVRFEKIEAVLALIHADANVNVTNNEGHTALMISTNQRKADVVRVLVDAGANIDVASDEGNTPLMIAVLHDNVEVVRVLTNSGANVDATNTNGRTSLMVGAQRGNTEVVRALIANTADVNARDEDGGTALFYASTVSEVTRLLIDAGVDVHIKDRYGKTALFRSVQNGRYPDIVRVLIEHGKARVNERDQHGRTPLFYALKLTSNFEPVLDVASLLLEKGADLAAIDDFNVSVLMFYLQNSLAVRGTPVYFYCDQEFNGALGLILRFSQDFGTSRKAIVNSIINFLFCTCLLPSSNKMVVIEALDISISYTNNVKTRKIIKKIRNILVKEKWFLDLPKLLDLLIQSGANPNATDMEGNTVIHNATLLPFIEEGIHQDTVIEILKKLQDKGVKFNKLNIHKETPIMYGLSSRVRHFVAKWSEIKTFVKVCQFLLNECPWTTCETNQSGQSVFHLILELFRDGLQQELDALLTRRVVLEEAFKLLQLLSPPNAVKGVTVNKTDDHLNTPLHLWASLSLPSGEYSEYVTKDSKFKELLGIILKHLLSCGVRLNSRNANDQTPLHLCKTWAAAELLIEAGAKVNDLDFRGRPFLLCAAQDRLFEAKQGYFYPDVIEDVFAFYKTCSGLCLNLWAEDVEGESILSVLINLDEYEHVKALIKLASQENNVNLEALLETICKDKSTRKYWKSTVVETLLKSKRRVDASTALRFCCTNIKETDYHDLHEIEKKSRNGDGDDSNGEKFALHSIHWKIAKQLRLYGVDGKSCEDILEGFPELKDLLTEEIDITNVPAIIPWTSHSEVHQAKLARVARRHNYQTVGTFWYHQDPIGSGSFGHVFAGINEKDGREVAIKKIVKLRLIRPEDKREIRNLTALADCQQVVRYVHFDDSDTAFVYIALELMEGHLDEYFESVYFDSCQSTSLCEDVAKGLKYLHQHKPLPILHRDLKPGNILYKLYPRLSVKISDFGLSSPLDASGTTVQGTNVGTRCWIAPEVIKCTTNKHSTASDVFSCGLLFHYILSPQNHPFQPVDCTSKSKELIDLEIQTNMLNGNMEGWDSSLFADSSDLIKGMLDSDDKERPTALKVLDHPMFWPTKKKLDVLSAVGNQPEFECPRAKRTRPLTAVEGELESNLPAIVSSGTWDDAGYKHMPTIIAEMTNLVKVDKKGTTYTVPLTRKYDYGSVVELIRFIRNAIAHVSDAGRSSPIKKQILEDCVFLEYFPNLVIEVFKAVTKHGWIRREEVKHAMNQ